MRIAAKRRQDWLMSSYAHEGTRQQVRLGGEWVDVVQWGEGDPIVLVPGLAGGWKLVAPLAASLARHHRVIVPGLRGDRFPGGVAWPRDLADHAHDLAGLIDMMGLERPTVLGVSFGGAIALELAVEYPQKLGALVLQGAASRFRTNLGSKIARRVLERFSLPSDNGFLNQFFNLLHGGKPESAGLADFVVECCWQTDQSIMAQRIGLLESFDVSDRLWQVESPTLVLAGSRDAIVPHARQRALAESIPGARFQTLEGAGHVGFLTHRLEVARQVRVLLRQIKHSPC